jgi:hypothetical protein
MGAITGEWKSTYSYHRGLAKDKHILVFTKQGSEYVGKSLPADDGSKLTIQLIKKGKILTGTWQETTSSGGEYEGRKFYGAVQYIYYEEKGLAKGKWVGFNSNESTVNSGEWKLKKL